MSVKRFKFDGGSNCIDYDGKSILLDSNGEKIEELLNALHKENQDLKKQMKRLYNYFEDFFSERVENNDFSEMWDFVAEDEKWD